MNELAQSVVRQTLVTVFLALCLLVVTLIASARVNQLEKQVQFLQTATRAAHDEAKRAQQMARNPHYLPNPMVKK